MKLSQTDLQPLLSNEMKKVLSIQSERAKNAFVTEGTPADLRNAYEKERYFWNQDGPNMQRIKDLTMVGPYGEVRFRCYIPQGVGEQQEMDLLLYLHGGGFVVGSCDTHDKIMRLLADMGNFVVVGLAYHLAPEYQFPVQIEECAFLLNTALLILVFYRLISMDECIYVEILVAHIWLWLLIWLCAIDCKSHSA